MAISVTDEDHHEQLPFMCIIFHQQYRIRHNLPAFRTMVKKKMWNLRTTWKELIIYSRELSIALSWTMSNAYKSRTYNVLNMCTSTVLLCI